MRTFFNMLIVMMMAFSVISCGSTETKDTSVSASGPVIQQINEQLVKIPVKGFGYKKTSAPGSSLTNWVKKSGKTVNSAVSQLPVGYVLQITGHADASGPEDPEGAKPGNLAITRDRAKSVYDALVASGVAADKLKYTGVGSSQLLDGVSPTSPKQRRVTFEVVPK